MAATTTEQGEMLNLSALKTLQRTFAEERDWDQFHTPKNLAMALAGEAGELLEIFQWLTPEQSFDIKKDQKKFENISDEIADILYYLVRMSDLLAIDLNAALTHKINKNALKYPVALARGNAKKYTEL